MSGPGVGSLVQLSAQGPQNEYLESSCGTDFFSLPQWRRPTRFALDVVAESFPNGFAWGKSNVIDIPRRADVLGDVILEIRLPALPAAVQGDSWVKAFGYVLLRRVRMIMDGTVVHDDERLWYDISDKLFASAEHEGGLDAMIGRDGLDLRTSHVVYVPLKLLCSKGHRSIQNFLPLLAMPGTPMQLEIVAEDIESCLSFRQRVPVTGTSVAATFASRNQLVVQLPDDPPLYTVDVRLDGVLISSGTMTTTFTNTDIFAGTYEVTYGSTTVVATAPPDVIISVLGTELDVQCLFHVAHLDTFERNQLVQKRFSMLYETATDVEALSYTENEYQDGVVRTPLTEISLDFSETSRATKFIAFVAYDEAAVSRKEYFTYLLDGTQEARILFDGIERVRTMPWGYFAYVDRYERFHSSRDDGIGAYSFAIDASSWQPCGTAPLGAVKRPLLKIVPQVPRLGRVYKAFTLSYNIIVVSKGHVTIAYAV
jgi:hypothetical protein